MTRDSNTPTEPHVSVAEAYARALNHVGSARWELERAHPHMDPDEPCVIFELWEALRDIESNYRRDEEHRP